MRRWDAVLTVVVSCLSHFIVLGFPYTSGIYQIVFQTTFQQSSAYTSWVVSTHLGMLCFAGPVASVVIGRYGCGMTIFMGGLLGCVGLLGSVFANSVALLIVSFGFVAGSGFSMAFTANIVVIAERFKTKRIVAAGLSVSGAGIGTVLWPWISRYLISEYGWRGALAMTCALCSHLCVFGMLLVHGDKIKPNQTFKDKAKARVISRNQNNQTRIEEITNQTSKKKGLIEYHTASDVVALRMNAYENSSALDIAKNKQLKQVLEVTSVFGSLDSFRSFFVSEPNFGSGESTLSNNGKMGFSEFRKLTVEIMSNYNYILLFSNALMFCFGFSIFYAHVVAFAESVGVPTRERYMIFLSLGITNIIGRVVLGLIGNHRRHINIVVLYCCCYVASGVATVGIVWWHDGLSMFLCASLFGFFSAAYGPLLTEVCFLFSGRRRFFLAYGYLLIFMGLGSIVGAPTAGFVFDRLHFYQASLYVGGASFIVAGLIILPTYKAARTPRKPSPPQDAET